MDAMLICLLIQEVEHIFDSQWEGTASVHSAEQGFKQIIHKLLQRTLIEAETKDRGHLTEQDSYVIGRAEIVLVTSETHSQIVTLDPFLFTLTEGGDETGHRSCITQWKKKMSLSP